MHFSTLAAAASALLLFQTITASPITSPISPTEVARRGQLLERDESPHDLYLKDDDDHIIFAELERVFAAIEEIPDDVLEDGDDATDAWMVEHGYRSHDDKRAVIDRAVEDRAFWDVARCAGAIGAFIASNVLGAAKLLRIKQYIAALGGIRKSAELLLKASTNAERLQQGGEVLALLAAEILGFSLVSNNC